MYQYDESPRKAVEEVHHRIDLRLVLLASFNKINMCNGEIDFDPGLRIRLCVDDVERNLMMIQNKSKDV